jgi:NarL family two-component system response regulator LiaR
MSDKMSETRPIRILIVDDHPMVRSGLQDFILANDGLELVGEAQNGVEAVDFCAAHAVDVVLMDLIMPLMDGSEATRRIIAQGKPVKIIALTSFHEQNLVEQALKAGATSYLLKNVSAGELVEATEALIGSRRQRPAVGFDLTEKEREVLPFLVKGFSNQEISAQLSISLATVKFHLNNIFTKLGAKNRVEAATIALEHDLVEKT